MNRREYLAGSAALLAATAMGGCARREQTAPYPKEMYDTGTVPIEASGWTRPKGIWPGYDRLRADVDVGAGSVYDLGRWMGFPYQPGYAAREAQYLRHEARVLEEIAAAIDRWERPHDVVVDMTGSAIYIDSAILARIRQVATVVYLAIAPRRHAQMIAEYCAQPRPVVWNGMFRPRPGESGEAALARCYTDLIAARETLYEALCDVRVDEALHQDPSFTAEALVRYVEHARKI